VIKLEARQYIEHLHEDTDGYIQIARLKPTGHMATQTRTVEELREILEGYIGNADVYSTGNSFYIPQRRVGNIRQLRALFVDLDLPNNISKTEAVYKVYDMVAQGEIPEPTMIVDSGRGLHLYWRIEHAPKQAIYTWQELEDYLCNKLKSLGADSQATDCARILRLPQSINSKNGAECQVLHIRDDLRYSMYDLREKYLGYTKQQEALQASKKKQATSRTIKHLFNSYTLHKARLEDIEKLCELRKWDMRGYRSFSTHLFTYWSGVVNRDIDILAEIVDEFNQQFREPLKQSEVNAIVRSVPKAIDKFLEYEQGLRAKKVKRVSKGMKDKGGYWYTNDTLIDRLGITLEEQRQLQTIIGKEEKYRRNNEKRRTARRNEQGETSREQLKRERLEEIHALKAKGMTNKQVAEQLQLTVKAIEYHLYK
jgi:hypothetical protein